jgi:hypothetical protein
MSYTRFQTKQVLQRLITVYRSDWFRTFEVTSVDNRGHTRANFNLKNT